MRKRESVRGDWMRGPDDRPLIDPIVSDAIVKTINNPILLEPVAEAIVDLSIAGWSAIKGFFSRPPAVDLPPPPAAAAPAPHDASVAPSGTKPGVGAAEPENAQDHVVGVQGVAPEPLEMVAGRDSAGNEIFVPIRKRPE